MARMSVDDSVARDPRITLLAKTLGWTRREALGCLVGEVWPICYDQVTHLVSPKLIDTAAEHAGFAAAMVECELASRDRSGKVYVNGAQERVKYIRDKQSAGREGGLKSGESRDKTPKQPAKQPTKQYEADGEAKSKQAEATRNPPASASASPPVPPPVPASDPAPVLGEVRLVTDAFQAYFVSRTNTKPSWGPTEISQAKTLLKKQDCSELVRRIAILRNSPPDFPKGVWDWKTFVANHDRCAIANNGTSKSNDGMAELFALAGEVTQ